MSCITRFEIAKQDGAGRIGNLDIGGNLITTPCLAVSRKPPLKHISVKPNPSIIPDLSAAPLILTILPSWQFLGVEPGSNASALLQELLNLVEKSKNACTFIQIPQDVAMLEPREESPYRHLYSMIQNDLTKKMPIAFAQRFKLELKTPINSEKSQTILVNLQDISVFLNRPKELLERLSNFRMNLTSRDLIFAPSVPPYFFPLLSYFGVDVFDASFAIIASIKGYYLKEGTLFPAKNGRLAKCRCSSCSTSEADDPFKVLLKHNLLATEEQIAKCQEAIYEEKLWDLVRRTAVDKPKILTAMRLLKGYYEFLEGNLPITKACYLIATTAEDLWRPEVVRYRQRIRERYFPPAEADICLVLPCSARKPYSLSKSHQRFSKVLKRFRKKICIVELMFTSPLGVVPRTLERIYPAASYDIPVTGDWTQIEQEMIAQAFQAVLKKISSTVPVLVHLNQIERAIMQNALEKMNHPIYFSDFPRTPHSAEGLKGLEIMLNKVMQNHQFSLKGINMNFQMLRDTLDYQFGKGTGRIVLDGSEAIKGKPHIRLQVYRDSNLILTYHAPSGMTTLSWGAFERLVSEKIHTVHFSGDRLEGSTLFCSAITYADDRIRPGDEVGILNSDKHLIGIGRSILSSKALLELQRGPGVKIRKKRENSSPAKQ